MQDFTYEYSGVQKTVLGIILGGGAGKRLMPLTKKRAKPAVPLGGNYRLVDIPISNCLHSNINKIYCLTQYNSASLNRHVNTAYNANVGTLTQKGFVEILAASQSPGSEEWFQGVLQLLLLGTIWATVCSLSTFQEAAMAATCTCLLFCLIVHSNCLLQPFCD